MRFCNKLKVLLMFFIAILLGTFFGCVSNGDVVIESSVDKPSAIPNQNITENQYVNNKYNFVLELPEYWLDKTYIAQIDDGLSTGALSEITFYNKYLYDKGETSLAYLFHLEVYGKDEFSKIDYNENQAGTQIIGENEKYVIIANLRTGMGIIEDEKGAEQVRRMDDYIENVLRSFKFN